MSKGASKRLLQRLGLHQAVLTGWRSVSTPFRNTFYDRPVIAAYVRSHAVKKLHVGSGTNLLDDWLNTHYHPGLGRIANARSSHRYLVHLDCGEPFPLETGSFRFVFTEHMIEHIPYAVARSMLCECYRVLGRGGKIRISTPDLRVFLGLYREDLSDVEKEYIESYSKKHYPDLSFPHPTFVLNNVVRAWHHTFIYDEDVLRHALESAGFADVTRVDFGISETDELAGLEHEERLNNRLESLILEATKP